MKLDATDRRAALLEAVAMNAPVEGGGDWDDKSLCDLMDRLHARFGGDSHSPFVNLASWKIEMRGITVKREQASGDRTGKALRGAPEKWCAATRRDLDGTALRWQIASLPDGWHEGEGPSPSPAFTGPRRRRPQSPPAPP